MCGYYTLSLPQLVNPKVSNYNTVSMHKRDLASSLPEKVGKKVALLGWADKIRDHGKITFIDLRDRSGKVQCVGEGLLKVTPESVVLVEGEVVKRPEKLINKDLETGCIEIKVSNLEVLSESKEIPLPPK